MKSAITLNCPTCANIIEWSDDFPFRPFCSQRCKQIDFGDWVDEKHRINGESTTWDSEQKPENQPF